MPAAPERGREKGAVARRADAHNKAATRGRGDARRDALPPRHGPRLLPAVVLPDGHELRRPVRRRDVRRRVHQVPAGQDPGQAGRPRRDVGEGASVRQDACRKIQGRRRARVLLRLALRLRRRLQPRPEHRAEGGGPGRGRSRATVLRGAAHDGHHRRERGGREQVRGERHAQPCGAVDARHRPVHQEGLHRRERGQLQAHCLCAGQGRGGDGGLMTSSEKTAEKLAYMQKIMYLCIVLEQTI